MSIEPFRFGPPRTPRPQPAREGSSPRLQRLAADLERGVAGAVESFWLELEAGGAPLIEPDATDPQRFEVTFLWRARNDDTRDVLLLAHGLTDHGNLEQSRLHRLSDTDVWYRTFAMRGDWRATYQLAPDDGPVTDSEGGWERLFAHAAPDPLNPTTFKTGYAGLSRGRGLRTASVVELPLAPAQPWWQRRGNVPRGAVVERVVSSQVLGNARRVWQYAPANGAPAGVLILFDGEVWGPIMDVWSTLDNLIDERRVPPLAAVLLDTVDLETRGRELTCYPPFLTFLSTELPQYLDLRVSGEHTIVAGQSLGGLTALFAGLVEPQRFRNVLSQSGSFWWLDQQPTPPEWLAQTGKHGPRIFLAVGEQEWQMLETTRHLQTSLAARGLDVRLTEFNGGHDHVCWRGGLADGLIALTRAWRVA